MAFHDVCVSCVPTIQQTIPARRTAILHPSNFPIRGLLKKAASGVRTNFPCSRTESTRRAQNRLRPFLRHGSGQAWTNPSTKLRACFFEQPRCLRYPMCLWAYLPLKKNNYSTRPSRPEQIFDWQEAKKEREAV